MPDIPHTPSFSAAVEEHLRRHVRVPATRRRAVVGSVIAGLLLAGGGVTVATSDEKQEARSPQTLAPRGPQAVGALERPGSPAPAELTAAMARLNITDLRLARELGGRAAYLGAMSDFTCLTVASGDGQAGSVCQTLETITQGHLWIAGSAAGMVGVAPDGVSEVLVTDDAGLTHRVPVVNNIYAGPRGTGGPARIQWQGTNGARADLRLLGGSLTGDFSR